MFWIERLNEALEMAYEWTWPSRGILGQRGTRLEAGPASPEHWLLREASLLVSRFHVRAQKPAVQPGWEEAVNHR